MIAMKFQAVVFDVSGTLLDDLYTVWRANSQALEACGFKVLTLEEFKERFQLPIPEFLRSLGVPPQAIQEVDKRFREFYPRYAPHVKIFPEVEEVLEQLKNRRIPLGVASNIPSRFLRGHLEDFGIASYFTVITGQEDCDEQKPSPKPILVTLEKMGMRPQEALYVGDMEEDILAGKRAGVITAAISREGSYHPQWRLKKQSPDYLISNLRELLMIEM
jgi:HAD superfamily hydrolase (TIGR01549 family)